MRAIAIIVTVATDAVLAEMRETVAAATDATVTVAAVTVQEETIAAAGAGAMRKPLTEKSTFTMPVSMR